MSSHTYVPAFTLEPTRAAAPRNERPANPTTPRFIDDVAAGRVELPTIPQVVQKVMAALRDPDVDARTVADLLSKDPVLSAKVLRVANSSHFGAGRSIASIDAALQLIGLQALGRLVVACGVSGAFKDVPGIDLHVFWRDALVAATAAHRLAGSLGADAQEAYVCGLLHAAGHLILCQSYPEIAAAMFEGFEIVRGEALSAIERDAFGIEHPEVGALWVESLGFPPSVARTIRRGGTTPLDVALTGACALAEAVARRDPADAALAVLPAAARAPFTAADGTPKPAFEKFHEQLLATEAVA